MFYVNCSVWDDSLLPTLQFDFNFLELEQTVRFEFGDNTEMSSGSKIKSLQKEH